MIHRSAQTTLTLGQMLKLADQAEGGLMAAAILKDGLSDPPFSGFVVALRPPFNTDSAKLAYVELLRCFRSWNLISPDDEAKATLPVMYDPD